MRQLTLFVLCVSVQVHEAGQLVDPDPNTLEFVGSIQLVPATS